MAFKSLLAAVVTALSLGFAGSAAAECKFVKLGEAPIRFQDGLPILDVTIKDQKLALLLSTSTQISMLSSVAAARLGLKDVDDGRSRAFEKTGKEVQMTETPPVDFSFGTIKSKDSFFVVATSFGEGADGLIGLNLLGRGDLELDFANKVMRIFDPKGCEASPLAYWSDNYALAPLSAVTRSSGELETQATINGQKVVAKFSSAASSTKIDLRVASRLGAAPGRAGVTPVAPRKPDTDRPIATWNARFDFALGEEAIKEARIQFADFGRDLPRESSTASRAATPLFSFDGMYIGADFFMAHRIYFARSQRQIYFTYNGGRVFDPGEPASR